MMKTGIDGSATLDDDIANATAMGIVWPRLRGNEGRQMTTDGHVHLPLSRYEAAVP